MTLAAFRDICSKLSPEYPNREHIDRGYWQAKAAEALPVACEEIERLQKIISEPVESFGTPELVAWAEGLQKILADFPEEERGRIPFALTMGCHQEKFAKSWNSPVMQEQAKQIEDRNLIIGHMQATSEIQAKRIAELEKALVEERARWMLEGPESDDRFSYANIHECPEHNDFCMDDCNISRCPSKKFWQNVAREQLRQEGKL